MCMSALDFAANLPVKLMEINHELIAAQYDGSLK